MPAGGNYDTIFVLKLQRGLRVPLQEKIKPA